MKTKKIGIMMTVIISVLFLSACTPLGASSCRSGLKKFDMYAEQSELPVIERNDSLCHDYFTGGKKHEKKIATAKLMSAEPGMLVFKGETKVKEIHIRGDEDIAKYKAGSYYNVDMNNICRFLDILVSSQMNPNIQLTAPEETECR